MVFLPSFKILGMTLQYLLAWIIDVYITFSNVLHVSAARLRHNSGRRRGLKHWVPYLDREGKPGLFHSVLRQCIFTWLHLSVENLEIALVEASLEGGTCSNIRFKYQLLAALRQLRKHRRPATISEARRVLSFEIRWQQRRELRTWKSMKLMEHLREASMWSALRTMDHHMVKTSAQEPHPNEFAKMLEELFGGIVTEPFKPDSLTEHLIKELQAAVGGPKWPKQPTKSV